MLTFLALTSVLCTYQSPEPSQVVRFQAGDDAVDQLTDAFMGIRQDSLSDGRPHFADWQTAVESAQKALGEVLPAGPTSYATTCANALSKVRMCGTRVLRCPSSREQEHEWVESTRAALRDLRIAVATAIFMDRPVPAVAETPKKGK